jgi:hypothetical protein
MTTVAAPSRFGLEFGHFRIAGSGSSCALKRAKRIAQAFRPGYEGARERPESAFNPLRGCNSHKARYMKRLVRAAVMCLC